MARSTELSALWRMFSPRLMPDLDSLTTLFVTLNLCLAGCGAYLLVRQRAQWRAGLAALGIAGLMLGALVAFATRLTGSAVGVYIVNVDLYRIVEQKPSLLADVGVAASTLGVLWIRHRTGRGGWAAVALCLAIVLWQTVTTWQGETDWAAAPVLAGAAIGLLAAQGAGQQPRRMILLAASALWVLGTLIALSAQRPRYFSPHLADDLPPGFTLSFYAELPASPAALAVDDDNRLYVGTLDGTVFVLHDRDGDGSLDERTVFAESLGRILGLAWHEGRLYISAHTPGLIHSGRVIAAPDANADAVADQLTDIVTDLPSGQFLHQNNGLAVGPDGRLYLGVGSTTDHDVETHPYAAAILSVNLDGSDLRLFATGLRNPYGLAFSPEGRLYATDNGPDHLNHTLHYVPPDELNLIVAGGNYGFPHYFGAVPAGTGTLSPVALFTMRTVPTGLAVYAGRQFPSEFHNNIFVAVWQKGPPMSDGLPQRGQRIARIVLSSTTGQWEDHDFVTDLSNPIAVATGNTGELYIADMSARRIYLVTFSP